MNHPRLTPRRAPAPLGRVRALGVWGPFRGPQEDGSGTPADLPARNRAVLRTLLWIAAALALATLLRGINW